MRPISSFITVGQRLIDKQNFIEIQPNKQYTISSQTMTLIVLSSLLLLVDSIVIDKPFPTNTVLYRMDGGAAQTYLYPQQADASNPNGLPSFLAFDDWVNPGTFVSGSVTSFTGDVVKNSTPGIFGRQFWGMSRSFVDQDGLGVTTYPTDFGGCQVVRCVDKKCSTFTRGTIGTLKNTVNFCDVKQQQNGQFVWAGTDPTSGLQFGVCNDKRCAAQTKTATIAFPANKDTGPSPLIGIHPNGVTTMMVVTDATAPSRAGEIYYVRCFDANCTASVTRGPLLKLTSFSSFSTTVIMKYKPLQNGESVLFAFGGKRVRCYDIDCAEFSVDSFAFPTDVSAVVSPSGNSVVEESSPGRMFMGATTSSLGSYVWRCFDVLCYYTGNVLHHAMLNSGQRGNKMAPMLADTANGSAIIIDSSQRAYSSGSFTDYDNTAAIVGYPDFDWGVAPPSLSPPTLARNVSLVYACVGASIGVDDLSCLYNAPFPIHQSGTAAQCPTTTTPTTTTATTTTTTTTKATTATTTTTTTAMTPTTTPAPPSQPTFANGRWEVQWPAKLIDSYQYSWNAMLPGSATANNGQPTVFLSKNISPYNTSIGIVQPGGNVPVRSLSSTVRTWRGIQTQRTATGLASFLQQGDFACVYHECVDAACTSYTAKSVVNNDQCGMGIAQGKVHYVTSSAMAVSLYRCDSPGCLTSTLLQSIATPQTGSIVRVMMTVVNDRVVIHAGVQSSYGANCLDLWLISCDNVACSCYQVREIARCAKSSSSVDTTQSMFALGGGSEKHVAFTSINSTVSRLLCHDIACTTVTIDAVSRLSNKIGNAYRIAERTPGQLFMATSSHQFWKCWDSLCYYNSTEVRLVRTSPFLRDATDAPGYLADTTSSVSYILDNEGNRDSFNPPTFSNIAVVELGAAINWGTAPSSLDPPALTPTSTLFVRTCSGTTPSTTTTTTKATTPTSPTTSTTTATGSSSTLTTPTTTTPTGTPTPTTQSGATSLTETSSSSSTATDTNTDATPTLTSSSSMAPVTTSTSAMGGTTSGGELSSSTVSVVSSSAKRAVSTALWLLCASLVA